MPRLRDALERLRADHAALRDAVLDLERTVKGLTAEVERVRGRMQAIREGIGRLGVESCEQCGALWPDKGFEKRRWRSTPDDMFFAVVCAECLPDWLSTGPRGWARAGIARWLTWKRGPGDLIAACVKADSALVPYLLDRAAAAKAAV